MIEKLVLGEIWTEDLPIFNPDALTFAPSWQAEDGLQTSYLTTTFMAPPLLPLLI